MGAIDRTAVLECVLCGERQSPDSVAVLEYFPSTGVCYNCYEQGQKAPYGKWCFGKTMYFSVDGKVFYYGYDAETKACSQECPDRKICPLFITGVIQAWREEMGKRVAIREVPVAEDIPEQYKVQQKYKGPRLPFRQLTMTCGAFMMCMKGVMIEALVKWVNKQGGNPRRVLRIMRSGYFNGKRWQVNEANGYLKVIYKGE